MIPVITEYHYTLSLAGFLETLKNIYGQCMTGQISHLSNQSVQGMNSVSSVPL